MADILSGQIGVTTAGTAQQGPNSGRGCYLIRPHPENTGDYIYIGNDGNGDVSSMTGLVVGKGESVVISVPSLNSLWFDVDSNNDKICWLVMDRYVLI